MDLSQPIKSVLPGAYADVLVVLARTRGSLTGRQVAALTDGAVSQPRVNAILKELSTAGVVDMEIKGRSHLYTMNREHLVADAVEQLASIRSRMIDEMERLVSQWVVEAVSVWLFGSAARGDGSAASDIDLLVIRPSGVDEFSDRWESQIHKLENHVSRWTGNDCRVIQYSPDDIDELDTGDDPLLATIRQEGLRITGDRRSLRTRANT